MPSTALQNAQEVAKRLGIAVPSGLFGTPNRAAAQLGGILNEVLEDLTERWNWPQAIRQASFQMVAGTDQGPVEQTIGGGFKDLVPDSGWNRTRNTHLIGPVNAVGWASLRAYPARGILDTFRMMEGRLHIDSPQAQVNDVITFEYYSTHVVQVSAGGFSQTYTADNDVCLLPDSVLRAGLSAFWKQVKGFSYAEEKRKYELVAGNAAARTGSVGRRYLDDGRSYGNSVNALYL